MFLFQTFSLVIDPVNYVISQHLVQGFDIRGLFEIGSLGDGGASAHLPWIGTGTYEIDYSTLCSLNE